MLEIKDAARLLIDQLGWVDVIDVDQSDGLVSYRKTTDRRLHVVWESAVLGFVQQKQISAQAVLNAESSQKQLN